MPRLCVSQMMTTSGPGEMAIMANLVKTHLFVIIYLQVECYSYCLCHSELDPCWDSITLEFNQIIDIYENLSNMCTNAQENGLCHSIYCQIVVQSKCYNFHY